MKKIHLLSGFLMLAVVTTLVACQKEQNGVSPQKERSSVSGSETAISGVAVNGVDVSGLISSSTAQEMHDVYVAANPNGTQYVEFQIKDLEGFLQILKSKYKSDVVRVNFGIYDSNTANDPANVGKTTVYFSGLDKRSNDGAIKTNATGDDSSLNHGSIWP